jgi:hypothetical protein
MDKEGSPARLAVEINQARGRNKKEKMRRKKRKVKYE